MNFRGRTWRKREDTQLELTPLIDIIFLLLVFFLITTTFVKQTHQETAIIISLPKGKMGVSIKEVPKITLFVDRYGAVFLGGDTALSLEQLKEELTVLHTKNSETLVELKADEKALHGNVTEILDIVNEVGFESIGVGLEDE